MKKSGMLSLVVGASFVTFSGWLVSRAEEIPSDEVTLTVEHPECTFFGDQREKFVQGALKPRAAETSAAGGLTSLSERTDQVTSMLGYIPGGSRTHSFEQGHQLGTIDSYLYADMQAAGVTPADQTTDWEFIRRVTLDLTGRIPTPTRVLSFVADTAPDKRAKLIDELLNKPEWVDKWTMYFGDLYKNTVDRPSTGLRRFNEGRNAFYKWIRDSLASGKPYNQMATELIAAAGDNSYQQGELNWIVGGVVTGGPVQDITDQQAANLAETFLGISHMNCLLCHNGRGHLDALSLWGKSTTRYQAWQFASFLAHTNTTRRNTGQNNVYYWSVTDNIPRDYTLGSTSGNRPARTPTPDCAAGKPCYVAPVYLFNGDSPNSGENYRASLAREITSDLQFSRATVNYIWNEFFGRGIVDPPNQFDPLRLDPDNPPPDPWTLQPSNARLLNALAQRFADGGYNLKSLMREIANSEAYQMSSRYNGAWNAAWEKLFARKFVRRLWAEEIHDALVQSSGIQPSYTVPAFNTYGYGSVSWAMQLPDTVNLPGGGTTAFLDSFLRGNRDDAERKDEGSVLQALNLMNDPFVQARIQPSGGSANQLLAANLSKPDDQLVSALFLGVLSRYPSDDEKATALAALKTGNRTQSAQDLLWSLYNKVDFVFNY